MSPPETHWVHDVPPDSIMTRQWQQQAIPWCTTHNDMASWDALNEHCWAWGRTETKDKCDISTGGPDHKWWKDA